MYCRIHQCETNGHGSCVKSAAKPTDDWISISQNVGRTTEYALPNDSPYGRQLWFQYNAVSLRVFSDDQVQDAISSIEHNNVRVRTLDELSAAIFDTHDNFKSTHADSTQQADRNQFWDEFREVIAVQLKREAEQ